FYSSVIGEEDDVPQKCEAWINRAIVIQHLKSTAMWAVIQIQDILGMEETLRRENPDDERINIPSDNKHVWNYRMHIHLEDLIMAREFNEDLRREILLAGR
ncbi:MAG TPA: 4-alpha-glucanotransferase, partial [Parasegetibacter sp.]